MTATRRMEFIARTQLTGAAASVSFATGLSGFTKFFLLCYIANDANAKVVYLRFNNDSGANYAQQMVYAEGTTVGGYRHTGATQLQVDGVGTTIAANKAAVIVVEVSKPVAGEVARATLRMASDSNVVGVSLASVAGEWTNTADLINRIDILTNANNITTGTRIVLWGSKD